MGQELWRFKMSKELDEALDRLEENINKVIADEEEAERILEECLEGLKNAEL